MAKINQYGFGFVGVLIVVVVLALIGAAGYYVYDQSQEEPIKENNTQVETARGSSDVPEAPQINSKEDLDKASAALDSADFDAIESEISSVEEEINQY